MSGNRIRRVRALPDWLGNTREYAAQQASAGKQCVMHPDRLLKLCELAVDGANAEERAATLEEARVMALRALSVATERLEGAQAPVTVEEVLRGG